MKATRRRRYEAPNTRYQSRAQRLAIRRAVFARDRGICQICRRDTAHDKPGTFGHRFEVHHLTPIVEGGTNELTNLATLCLRCHRRESAELASRRAQLRRFLPADVTRTVPATVPRNKTKRNRTEMKANEAFPSKWLKAQDFEEDERRVVTIARVTMETVGMPPNAEERPALHFEDFDGTLPLICNKTNWNTLIKLLGNETDDWTGHKITLFTAEVQFKDQMVMSVRVSQNLPKARQKTVKAEPVDDYRPGGVDNGLPATQAKARAKELAGAATTAVTEPPGAEDDGDPFADE